MKKLNIVMQKGLHVTNSKKRMLGWNLFVIIK